MPNYFLLKNIYLILLPKILKQFYKNILNDNGVLANKFLNSKLLNNYKNNGFNDYQDWWLSNYSIKKTKNLKINFKNLKIVAQQLENFNKPYILIHGAGSYGHPLVQQSRIHQGITNRRQLIAFAQTQRQQNLLNTFVCEELIKRKIPAFPTQVSSNAVMSKGRLIQMNTTAIIGLLKIGIVPVCYGVPAYDQQKKCSILSGDQIAPYLAKN